MNNLRKVFSGQKAFIPFLTCGDPSIEITEQLIYTLEQEGADLIELGIPFSDPTAEGPTIQAANLRSLAQGTTTGDVFRMVGRVRRRSSVPLAIMTYANVVFAYGVRRFALQCSLLQIDALILPDVPFEEKAEFEEVFAEYDVGVISFVAPTSADRVERIAREAKGFIYGVSSLGVTGARNTVTTDLSAMVKSVRACTDTPLAIGFGISTPEQARHYAQLADGVIVGSAIVSLCGQHGENCVEPVRAFVRSMRQALDQVDTP